MVLGICRGWCPSRCRQIALIAQVDSFTVENSSLKAQVDSLAAEVTHLKEEQTKVKSCSCCMTSAVSKQIRGRRISNAASMTRSRCCVVSDEIYLFCDVPDHACS
jgi:hypothetical protein